MQNWGEKKTDWGVSLPAHAINSANVTRSEKNEPAKRASSSSLLLGTMLFVDGMKVQQGQWTPSFRPRLFSEHKEARRRCECGQLFKTQSQTHSTPPGSDTQSLMVSVTSTEIQDPFDFG